MHGHDEPLTRVALDLAPQIGDVRIHRPLEPIVIGPERAGHQLLARERAPRVPRERFQQPEFGRREHDGLAIHADLALPVIDRERTDTRRRRPR